MPRDAAPDPPPARGVERSRRAAPVVAVLAVASLLALFRLGHQSYWDDEVTTVVLCKAPLVQRVVAFALLDVSPPLYYVFLGWWERASDHETWMRLFSVLATLGALPAAYAVGARTVGRGAAHVGLALLAVLPLAVYCAQEVRSYALFHLAVAALALALLVYRRSGGRARWLAVVGAGAAVLYTHYYGLFIVAGFFAWGLWTWRRRDEPSPERGRNAALALAAGGVLWLPWVPALVYQLRGGQGWRPRLGALEVLDRVLIYFTTGHTPRVLPVLFGDADHATLRLTLIALPLVLLVAIGLCRRRGPSEATNDETADASLLAFWLGVPLALVLAVSRFTPILNERACLGFYVPAALLAGQGAVALWRRSRALAVAPVAWLVLAALTSLRLYYFDPAYEKQDWRGLAERIAADARPDEDVLFHSESRELGFRYYNRGRVPLVHVFHWIPPENLAPDQKRERIDLVARDLAATRGGVWFVDYHGVGFDRERRLEAALAEAFAPVEEWSRYDGAYRFRVVHYRRRD